ncbi:MAG: bifunctional [glutamine synthetase] adenylyltransferase/[glutamine synthetase]-adenylyl-L-tyrosine phosphorylase [Actinomycetota bacterium]|nr:bifunctional [glutamine synthetase] adenylyltransferase/[glutamine synthetase]-adenylyl-L-tyrosine phosphorylase [Actinomycetota bacterium]
MGGSQEGSAEGDVNPSLAERREAATHRGSKSLTDLLERDERARDLLAEDGPLPDRDSYGEIIGDAAKDGFGGLLQEKRRRLLEIAARDLAGEIGLEQVGAALADLADASLESSLGIIGAPADLGIIGMGKLGGAELNYSSDIDIIFVAEESSDAVLKAATALLRELGSPSGQGYRIDVDLRPEGRAGALVRSLDATTEYYRRWAESWEHQAFIKARPSAGGIAIGQRLIEQVHALVFTTDVSPERISSIRHIKERVERHAARSARRARASELDDVKLGPGGIRDIEFSIQLLQLVHGGSDPAVRPRNTLQAMSALVDGGYMAEDDGAGLSVAYRWLRTVEHRLQLWQERQIHHLPRDEAARAQLARIMGYRDSPAMSALGRFEDAHRGVLSDVRSRFEKLFYRPMIETLADPAGPGLSRDALKDRLRVLGFRDVDRAARTLDGLVAGTSRRAKLFRVLTPALLRSVAATPMPDQGLFGFLRLGEALGGRIEALGALRDNPPGIAFLARVLGSGRFLGDVLEHVPEEVATIADPRDAWRPKRREDLLQEARSSLEWRGPEARLDGLRRFKRREMLRVALADLSQEAGHEEVGAALSDLADACLETALPPECSGFAVIGMGKLGGRELSYGSDIDVMFVHEGEHARGEQIAEELLRAIGEVTPEGQAFRIDAALRPEGRSGPLTRSLASFDEYYARWSQPWEHLALIKARPCAGDLQLGQGLVDRTRALCFPNRSTQAAIAEIRHLKARMEKERIPRGVDPRRHIKLGPGGLSDVEFATQSIQYTKGSGHLDLQVPSTLDALRAAARLDLIPERDARLLADTYVFLSRLRDRLFFMLARPTDVLPVKPEELEALGIAMGYTDQPRQELEERFLRITRRARKIAEPLIYG